MDQNALSERVAQYYSTLSSVAKDLNAISDQLSKCIADVDLALKRLNLGVVVWVPISHGDELPEGSAFWSEEIGYAKIGPNWGISLRKVLGDYQRPDNAEEERWLFNDAPRALRISAIEKIPELLESLSNQAVKTTAAIGAKLNEAKVVAAAITGAVGPPKISRELPNQIKISTLNVDAVRNAVSVALNRDGHAMAEGLLSEAKWSFEGTTFKIEVAAKATMIRLTFNANAEKIIRQELTKLGVPARFTIVPIQPAQAASTTTKASASLEGRK